VKYLRNLLAEYKPICTSNSVTLLVPSNLTTVSDYNQTVVEGSNITLVCTAMGTPLPNITWTKVLENGGNGEVLHRSSTWKFPNISRTVSGKYRCTASNGFGNPVSHKVEVTVLCEYITCI